MQLNKKCGIRGEPGDQIGGGEGGGGGEEGEEGGGGEGGEGEGGEGGEERVHRPDFHARVLEEPD